MTKGELEKEVDVYFKSIVRDYNEEYERTGKRHYFVGFDIKNAYIASAEPREKRIEELQKENAELKEKLEHRNCLDCSNHDSNIKLAKAKKIIKEFMKYEITEYDGSLEIHFEELKKQAEQFLSEVKK